MWECDEGSDLNLGEVWDSCWKRWSIYEDIASEKRSHGTEGFWDRGTAGLYASSPDTGS